MQRLHLCVYLSLSFLSIIEHLTFFIDRLPTKAHRKVFDVLLEDISIKPVTSWLLDSTVFGLSAACHPCYIFLWYTYLEYASSIWGSPCIE